MARKKAAATTPEPTSAPISATPDAASAPATPLEPVKVNNANLTELKIACDDAVRRYFSRPDQFKVQNTHTDVRLALGWTSVLVALATGLYGWKTEFEASKPLVWAGFITCVVLSLCIYVRSLNDDDRYLILTGAQTAYAYFVEGKTVFVGKRKTLVSRIETERLTLASDTIPPQTSSSSPQYSLTLTYVRSSNGGKTLVKRKTLAAQRRPFVEFFDGEGTLDEVSLDLWLAELCSSVTEQGPVVAS